MKRLRVLFLSPWYPIESDTMLGLFVQKHARAASGIAEVWVLYAYPDPGTEINNKLSISTIENVNEIRIAFKPSSFPFFIARIIDLFSWFKAIRTGWRMLKAQDKLPDIVHSNIFVKVPLIAYLLNRKYNIPFVVTEHWSKRLNPPKTILGHIENFAIRKILKRASDLSCVSSLLGNAMLSQRLAPSYTYLPNIVDCELFTIASHKAPKEYKTIVHISCFDNQSKNISGILSAIEMLSKKRQDFRFYMIGNGPDFSASIEEAKKKEIFDTYVFFTGVLEGEILADSLSSADFSVLYSNYETFGIVVYESLACGVPVVVSDVADYPTDIAAHLGMLVQKGEPELLAQAMDKMLDTYQDYDKNTLRNFAVDNFSAGYISKKLNDIYNKAILRP
ncbi:MAG: glycosyltransferase [Bacteroidales bacterium]|nr:glycosyltransferase [Bacteroidales bacterium]